MYTPCTTYIVNTKINELPNNLTRGGLSGENISIYACTDMYFLKEVGGCGGSSNILRQQFDAKAMYRPSLEIISKTYRCEHVHRTSIEQVSNFYRKPTDANINPISLEHLMNIAQACSESRFALPWFRLD